MAKEISTYHSRPEMNEKIAVVSDSEEEEENDIGDENLSSVAIEIPAEVWATVLDCEFIRNYIFYLLVILF